MKFKKYIKEESTTSSEKLILNEDIFNPDASSVIRDELDSFYAPVEKLIKAEKFEEAKQELDALEADLNDLEQENSRKKFFRFPQFMIDGQRKQIEALRNKLPKTESIEDMDRRCEKCNTLLNDGGTCPKCDDGEEDYGDELKEEMSVREKLKAAYPELNFDTPVTEECATKDCMPSEVVEEECMKEKLSNKEKLLRAFPELNFDVTPSEDNTITEETFSDDEYDEYSDYDDDYEMDDVEMDRAHAALYGGDRMYCDCGAKLAYDDGGSYCPECNPRDPEEYYDDDCFDSNDCDETPVEDIYDDNM